MTVRSVADDQWEIVAWLWQAFKHDLSPIVQALPYADGRYQHGDLDGYPGSDRAGYLAWAPHPKTLEEAPVAFALVDGLGGERRSLAALFVVPLARRSGVGRALAVNAIRRHPGPWAVGFQHDNAEAGQFWRSVATEVWGQDWAETRDPVRGLPDVPADHFIRAPA